MGDNNALTWGGAFVAVFLGNCTYDACTYTAAERAGTEVKNKIIDVSSKVNDISRKVNNISEEVAYVRRKVDVMEDYGKRVEISLVGVEASIDVLKNQCVPKVYDKKPLK